MISYHLAIWVVLACVFIAADAPALQHHLTGKKLLLKSNGKLVILSKDQNVTPPSWFPPLNCGFIQPYASGEPSITIDNGSNTYTFTLPCTNWLDSGDGKLAYKNSEAPGGPSAVKVVKMKDGLLKVVGKGTGIPVPNGPATINVAFNWDGFQERYCMSFSGTGDGSKFLVKDAAAGTCAPAPCQATTGGFCWFTSAGLQHDCDTACANAERPYDNATATYAGSSGSTANCQAIHDDLGLSGTIVVDPPIPPPFPSGSFCDASSGGGLGCTTDWYCSSPPTTANAVITSLFIARICACQ